MTVDKALATIQKIIDNTLEEYNQSPESQTTDDSGNQTRIPHPLDIVDEQDELFALDMSLKDVALSATPVSLIETTGSTASELKRISTDYYVRVPAEPASGQNLDIDDGLAYAVVFRALGLLWREYGEYEQRADSIINTYVQAYRDYLNDLIAGTVGSGAETYIRFSADGTDWHDSYTAGDIYISFKKIDTDTWTPAIRFVGQDGADGQDGEPGTPCSDTRFIALQDTPADYTGMGGKIVAVKSDEDGVEFVDAPSGSGGGASTFLDLTDTPASYTAGKFVSVNADGDALEFVDAPGGGVSGANVFGDNTFYDDQSSGTINLDASTYNVFYLYPQGDAELHFTQFDDGGQVSAWWGTTYTFLLVSSGSNAITFDPNESILGDASVGLGSDSSDTNITMTVLKMVYTGYDWYVVSKNIITDANG